LITGLEKWGGEEIARIGITTATPVYNVINSIWVYNCKNITKSYIL
jgi:hypothetical protein